jgi:hypothetical protein
MMKSSTTFILCALTLFFTWACNTFASESDIKGSQDHPLVTRMPGFYIAGYEKNNFDNYLFNIELSQKRAVAVVSELVSRYTIDAASLTPVGVGPLCPVESNRSPQGRAKNRRVELVER